MMEVVLLEPFKHHLIFRATPVWTLSRHLIRDNSVRAKNEGMDNHMAFFFFGKIQLMTTILSKEIEIPPYYRQFEFNLLSV